MNKTNNNNINMVCEKLEKIAADLVNITSCLETLENSLFFASERKDRDMTKPCSTAACVIAKMVDNSQEELQDLIYSIKEAKEV